jgi:ferric iron reductase protein FhuF
MGTIQDKLQQAREIFVTDIDEETRADNLSKINEWDKSIRENSAFAQWQSNDISQMLIKQFREMYKDASMQLAENRHLTEEQRESLWAKKDAALVVLGLLSRDAERELESVHKEISYALNST